MNYITVSLSI